MSKELINSDKILLDLTDETCKRSWNNNNYFETRKQFYNLFSNNLEVIKKESKVDFKLICEFNNGFHDLGIVISNQEIDLDINFLGGSLIHLGKKIVLKSKELKRSIVLEKRVYSYKELFPKILKLIKEIDVKVKEVIESKNIKNNIEQELKQFNENIIEIIKQRYLNKFTSHEKIKFTFNNWVHGSKGGIAIKYKNENLIDLITNYLEVPKLVAINIEKKSISFNKVELQKQKEILTHTNVIIQFLEMILPTEGLPLSQALKYSEEYGEIDLSKL